MKLSLRSRLEALRLRLSHPDALIQLSLFGALSGILTALVIVAFRLSIERSQALFLPSGEVEQYEGLAPGWRFLLPLLGAFAIGLLFQWAGRGARVVGVVHVMERLAYHQGHLPFKNALVQFLAAAVAIVSGHSVGREGPGVHLGAAAGSLLGQGLRLPNNSIRSLVACGVAASIAASFNTPLAGVIFAMEVVMMEYTISSFAPVILAAVGATAVTRTAFGDSPAFDVPPLTADVVGELPWMLLLGIVCGALGAGFIGLLERSSRLWREAPMWGRLLPAGLIAGLAALWVPAVMGIGYDTVDAALGGELLLGALLAVAAAKLIVSAVTLGLGVPAGLIGPTLVIGAAAGGVVGVVVEALGGSGGALYVLVGMAAMMSGTLHAPLAALMAMLEMTVDPGVILPGMLGVVAAYLVCGQLFGKAPVFLALMRARGLDYRNDPVAQSLRAVGVLSAMEVRVREAPARITLAAARNLVAAEPRWILVTEDKRRQLLPTADLARHLAEVEGPEAVEEVVNLQELPASRRVEVGHLPFQASLQEAREELERQGVDALCVVRGPGIIGPLGVLTRERIEEAYLRPAVVNEKR